VRERDVLVAAGERHQPHSAARRALAARLVDSLARTAQVTITATADVTGLVTWRAAEKARTAGASAPTITNWLVHIVSRLLREHPLLHARWEEEALVILDAVHVGIAVDTEAGLLVPVIRNADRLSLREIGELVRDLAARARSQRLRANDLQGGTFTVSNLGSFGVETFTPILNPPETAVLGAGRIRRQPVVVGEQIVPRDLMPLSLTFDHRVTDGAPAARFLEALRRRLAEAGVGPAEGCE
jgi:pyruvate dehydrogenase E2 component (dihydrolipoamide acetyltransferase)